LSSVNFTKSIFSLQKSFTFCKIRLARIYKMYYYTRMTLDEINEQLKAPGRSVRWLANELEMNEAALGQILLGKRPLKPTLAKHIEYVLGKREAILVYRVDVTAKKVEELTAGKGCKCEKDRVEAMQAIIAHNMQALAELGARAGWTPEQLKAWGLADGAAPASAPYGEALDPFA
jgi:hypothetical protein